MEKIIIVEDDNVIREELSGFLRRYNYEVSAPHSFEDIIDFILSEKADLGSRNVYDFSIQEIFT